MLGPAYLSQPTIERIPVLLGQIKSGHIRIPRFQRPFVWSDDQRVQLCNSIYQGMPIGSILVWRTKEHNLRSYSKLGHLLLDFSASEKDVKQYLLDGHQRVTTLYSALAEGLIAAETENDGNELGSPEAISDDGNWPIFFDLENEEFQIHKRKRPVPREWLRLAILLDPYQLHEFQGSLRGHPEGRVLIRRAENLANIFKDYSVPTVPIVTDDLDLVTESFQRINSAGTPMDEVHMINALAYSEDFELNEKMELIQEELGEVGWQDLEEKMILNTCKAFWGLDIYKSSPMQIKNKLLEQKGILDESAKYLKVAGEFLREECWVYGPQTLPYSLQVVLLADAIRWASEVGSTSVLTQSQRASLRKWFWHTTFTEYFATINSTRLRLALENLRKIVIGDESLEQAGFLPKVSPIRRFDFRAARSRGILLLMAQRLNPLDGDGNDQGAHRLLAEKGNDATPKLIPNRKILDPIMADGVANRIILSPEKAVAFKRMLMKDPGSIDPKILESHGFVEAVVENLVAGDIDSALRERRDHLLEMELEFVEGLGLEYVLD